MHCSWETLHESGSTHFLANMGPYTFVPWEFWTGGQGRISAEQWTIERYRWCPFCMHPIDTQLPTCVWLSAPEGGGMGWQQNGLMHDCWCAQWPITQPLCKQEVACTNISAYCFPTAIPPFSCFVKLKEAQNLKNSYVLMCALVKEMQIRLVNLKMWIKYNTATTTIPIP